MVINIDEVNQLIDYVAQEHDVIMEEIGLGNQDTDLLVLHNDVKVRKLLPSMNIGDISRPYDLDYEPTGAEAAPIVVKGRMMETYLSEVFLKEDPLRHRDGYLGRELRAGVNPQDMPWEAKIVSALITKLQKEIYVDGLYYGVRNELGTTPIANFNGYFKIMNDAIGSEITTGNKNLYEIPGGAWTENNTLDRLQMMYFEADKFEGELCNFDIPIHIYRKYCKNYAMLNGGVVYNDGYEQTYLEGSDKLCMLKPYRAMKKSDDVILTVERNFHAGYDLGNYKFLVRPDNNPKKVQFYLVFNFGAQIQSLQNIVLGRLVA